MDAIKITSSSDVFTVQTSFVDKYIKDVDPSFIKIYIYSFQKTYVLYHISSVFSSFM